MYFHFTLHVIYIYYNNVKLETCHMLSADDSYTNTIICTTTLGTTGLNSIKDNQKNYAINRLTLSSSEFGCKKPGSDRAFKEILINPIYKCTYFYFLSRGINIVN